MDVELEIGRLPYELAESRKSSLLGLSQVMKKSTLSSHDPMISDRTILMSLTWLIGRGNIIKMAKADFLHIMGIRCALFPDKQGP